MTCYVKHISEIMRRSGAENTYENKKMLDSVVREVLGMQRADCPEVWKAVKATMFSGSPEKKKAFEEKVVRIMVTRLISG